jgi:hypothetical protein
MMESSETIPVFIERNSDQSRCCYRKTLLAEAVNLLRFRVLGFRARLYWSLSGSMDTPEVIEADPQGNGGFVVLQHSLRRHGQPSEPSHPHPAGEVKALCVGRADFVGIGIASYYNPIQHPRYGRGIAMRSIGHVGADVVLCNNRLVLSDIEQR